MTKLTIQVNEMNSRDDGISSLGADINSGLTRNENLDLQNLSSIETKEKNKNSLVI